MAEQIEQVARTAGRTFNITLAELAGANAGQRNDLLALSQAVYRVPDGTLYTSTGGQLVLAQGLPVAASTNPLTGGIELTAGGHGFNITGKYPSIDALGGVVAFWDFSEPRPPFLSKSGMGNFPLTNGVGSRVSKGSGGPLSNSVVFNGTTDYLKLDSASVSDLNIGAYSNSCFVLAFVKRTNGTAAGMIAGCWQEDDTDPRRQYALFLDLSTYGGDNKVCFHVSKTGGASPNIIYSRDYSSNASTEPGLDFSCVSGSYDGAFARSYTEGRFEPWASYTETATPTIGEGLTYAKNPYSFGLGLNSTPCDFTVGACKVTGIYSNFFAGEVAALLVMSHAPSATEIASIQNAIVPASSGFKTTLHQFNQAVTGVSDLYGCKAYRGATALNESTSNTGVFLRTNTGSPGQGFIYRSSTSSAGIALFINQSVPSLITTETLGSFTLQLANANASDVLRFCLQIDGTWYATEATYAVAALSGSGADWTNAETKTLTFAKTAALWRDVTLTDGSSLVLAGSARGSNLPSGTITGWGVFSPAVPVGNVRFRNAEFVTLY